MGQFREESEFLSKLRQRGTRRLDYVAYSLGVLDTVAFGNGIAVRLALVLASALASALAFQGV